MFDLREVSWVVAFARFVLSSVITVGVLATINLFIYLGATNSTYNERIAAAFKDSYDYGYSQTFDSTYQKAVTEGFDKGYIKGYEISQTSNSAQPASRLVQTHNPTYAEVKAFLEADKTDSNPYIDGHYVCFEYAADVNNNADSAGIQAAYVRLRSTDWGHAVVAFNTVDRGLIFIEPQSDGEVTLIKGQPYPWQQGKATSPLSSSDPILEIEIIW